MGWGEFLGNVSGWFTPKQRVRRIKDKLRKLERQKRHILKERATYEKANKLMDINGRINELRRMLQDSSG